MLPFLACITTLGPRLMLGDRGSYMFRRIRNGALFLALASLIGGCSGFFDPTGPAADVVGRGDIHVESCDLAAIPISCRYSFELVNNGKGCAQNVHGSAEILNGASTTLGSRPFSYASRVRPNEVVSITGCCLDPTGMTQSRITPSWDNVRCN